jgi:hypothetical protein
MILDRDNSLNVFSNYPWDRGEKPYFINEEGFEWYVDKLSTRYAEKDQYLWNGSTRKGLKDVVAFYVKKDDVIKSVLINNKQEIICEADGFVGLAHLIDVHKISEDYKQNMSREEINEEEERKLYIKEVLNYIK